MRLARALLFPVIAAILVGAALLAPTTSSDARRPTKVAVTESAYACPAGSVITVGSGQIVAGSGSTASVVPGRARAEALEDAQTWRSSIVKGHGVIVQQRGRGSGAAGFFAGTAPKSGGGGLVVGSCPGIVDDAWMLGLGSGGKHFSTLILTNLADSPAAVDVSLWSPKGEIDAVDSEGIVVKPFSVRRIRLDDLAAGESELAMHVHRRRGSLSAVVNDTSTATYRGTEPVSATASPRRRQVIGGLVEGAAGRTLMVLNPGKSTARVGVQVIGSKNTFVPSGLDTIKVPAGTVRSVEVPHGAGSGRQALQLISDHPVSATVRMSPGAKDYAYAESVPALDGPAIVPVALGKGVRRPDLVLTAPGPAASVEVTAHDASMKQLATKTVAVAAETTTHLDSGKAFTVKGIAYLVLRPKGRIVAAATYTDKGGISSLALTTAPVTVLGPQVRPR